MNRVLYNFLRSTELPYFPIDDIIEIIKLNVEVSHSLPRCYEIFYDLTRIVIPDTGFSPKYRDLEIKDWIVVRNIKGSIVMYIKTNKFYEVRLDEITGII